MTNKILIQIQIKNSVSKYKVYSSVNATMRPVQDASVVLHYFEFLEFSYGGVNRVDYIIFIRYITMNVANIFTQHISNFLA